MPTNGRYLFYSVRSLRPLKRQALRLRPVFVFYLVAWTLCFGESSTPPPPTTVPLEKHSPGSNSPTEVFLKSRAIPELDLFVPETDPRKGYVQLFRLVKDFYNNIFASPPPGESFIPDPSTYREVTSFEPIRGLQPERFAGSIFEFHPNLEISQSYDSNVLQSVHNHIGDFFTTPRFAFEMQVGTPDSVFVEAYDTIFALHMEYLVYADLFARHTEFDAINQKLDLTARIGRSDAIWRPYFSGADVTGTNLLIEEREERLRRQRVSGGFTGEYRLSSMFSWNQNFEYSLLNHPVNPEYLNTQVWRTYQEVGYKVLRGLDFLLWGEYRSTWVNHGGRAVEEIGGIGWRGKFDPRLYSDFTIGWDGQQLSDHIGNRSDMSGIRLLGHTSFEWSPRLRLVVRYDREYTFNELAVDDNYVNTAVQFRPEIFLGQNWFITPELGLSYDEFETSHERQLEIRPELELSYALAEQEQQKTKLFIKFGYDYSATLNGPADVTETFRCSTGLHWNF